MHTAALSAPYRASLAQRMDRHRAFLSRHDPGDLLVYVNGGRTPSLEVFLCQYLHAQAPEVATKPETIRAAIQAYVASLREAYPRFYAIDDDKVPCAVVHWGMGGVTAAMIGGTPLHDGGTSWLEPNLDWPDIAPLKFDPDNPWIRFAVDVNQALWENWDHDFMVLPYVHRSPLDAANGIRGTDLFLDMYVHPERVSALTEWCADWSIAVEALIKQEAPRPTGWGVGVWGMWLPDDAVFVNGDPVGLINPNLAKTFDQPSNEKLFTHTGGGFFHNHTIGLHQVDVVSTYRGVLAQWLVDDPGQPSLAAALLDQPRLRDRILASSLQCPVAGWVPHDRLDEILDITVHGRFALTVACPENVSPEPLMQKVRSASNLK